MTKTTFACRTRRRRVSVKLKEKAQENNSPGILFREMLLVAVDAQRVIYVSSRRNCRALRESLRLHRTTKGVAVPSTVYRFFPPFFIGPSFEAFTFILLSKLSSSISPHFFQPLILVSPGALLCDSLFPLEAITGRRVRVHF